MSLYATQTMPDSLLLQARDYTISAALAAATARLDPRLQAQAEEMGRALDNLGDAEFRKFVEGVATVRIQDSIGEDVAVGSIQ